MAYPNTAPSRPTRPRVQRATAEPDGMSKLPVLRLLPIVIAAAVFMLGFRVQVVVQNIANTRMAKVELGQATALAQGAPAAPASPPSAAPQPSAAAKDAMPPAEGAAPPAEGAPAAEAGSDTPPTPVNFDPASLTKSEIDILQRLAERREVIETRERELVAKEGLIKAAEARIDGKITQLQDLEKNIKTLLQQHDTQKDAQIDQLVKIYGAMKPKDAARIFDSLEMPILVSVVQKMTVTKSAPIMALMDPTKTTALTEELTARKQLSNAGP